MLILIWQTKGKVPGEVRSDFFDIHEEKSRTFQNLLEFWKNLYKQKSWRGKSVRNGFRAEILRNILFPTISRFLFCPDPTTTTTFPSTFGDMVKKENPSSDLSFWIRHISLLKKYKNSRFFGHDQKSMYQRPWKRLQRTILMFWSWAQLASMDTIIVPRPHDGRTPTPRTTKPSAPPAVHGRI